ncbi:transposase [Trichonephila clavata]|uniref:Transposase n=1 Tax=Trichonephila clavata TaxID=2740835 RepID=A0A8X6HED3_TRICU|nr:transposase [Trichonephila clavata]
MRKKHTNVRKMWGDMGYQGKDLKDHIKREYDIEIEIVKRPPSRFWVHKDTPPELLPKVEPGFKVQPRRWVVERTFAGSVASINCGRRRSLKL